MIRVLVVLALGCGGGGDAPPALVFAEVPSPGEVPDSATVDAEAPSEARAQVVEAARSGDVPPTFLGGGSWTTVAVGPRGRTPSRTLEIGRTFVRQGGARLDVRMGAGDRGTFMGGIVESGVDRAMIQVRLEDPTVVEARFAIRLYRFGGPTGRPDEVTPTYLQRPVARGTYRAWVDVPARGGRFVVEAQTVDHDGNVIGRAWASPMEVRRAWL